MNIIERTESGVTIFVIDGRIDSEGAVDLDMTLQAAVTQDKYKLVLDMAAARYINSSGLRTLADILTKCKENNGDLKLAALSPKVHRVLQIVGFDNFFSIHETTESAVSAF